MKHMNAREFESFAYRYLKYQVSGRSREQFWRWVREDGPWVDLSHDMMNRLYGFTGWEIGANIAAVFEKFLPGRTPQAAFYFTLWFNPIEWTDGGRDFVDYILRSYYHRQIHKEPYDQGYSRRGEKRIRLSDTQRARRRQMIRGWREVGI